MERSAKSEGSQSRREKHSSRSEKGKAEWEPHRSSEPPAQTPQPRWALRLRLQRSVPGRGLGLAVWRQPKGIRSSVPQAGEWYAKGWGVESHSRGNLGEGPDPQERQRHHCWGGREEAGHHRKLLRPECVHVLAGLQGGGQQWHRLLTNRSRLPTHRRPGISGTGYPWREASCSYMGDWVLPEWATSDQPPLV